LVGPSTMFDAVEPFRLGDSRVGQRVTRLVAGVVTEVTVATPDVAAVSANFVAVTPNGPGYLTLYDCRVDRPIVSSVAYAPFDVVANEAIVPLQDGKLCVYSKAATDVVIDVNGFFRQDATSGFVPTTPTRIYDSRDAGRLAGRSRFRRPQHRRQRRRSCSAWSPSIRRRAATCACIRADHPPDRRSRRSTTRPETCCRTSW
jgi:hypothetical protein